MKIFIKDNDEAQKHLEKYIVAYVTDNYADMQRAIAFLETQMPTSALRDLILDVEFYLEYGTFREEE